MFMVIVNLIVFQCQSLDMVLEDDDSSQISSSSTSTVNLSEAEGTFTCFEDFFFE